MISVVIPAFNGAQLARPLIEDIRRTALQDYEIIVVDDASTDGSADVFEELDGVDVIRVAENRGPAHARNLGISRSKGSILIFVDDDVRLPQDRDVLFEMNHVFRTYADVDCISTITEVVPLHANAISYNTSIYHAYYVDRIMDGAESRRGRIMFFSTRLGGIRREKVLEAGGFYETLGANMCEDGELGTRCYHLGYQTYMSRRLTNLHLYPTDFYRFVRAYAKASMAQCFIDRHLDTSVSILISPFEKARRLGILLLLLSPVLLLVLSWQSYAACVAAGLTVLLLSFGHLGRLMLRHVPPRLWVPWFLIYAAITPFIIGGYAYGLFRYLRGDRLFEGKPSTLGVFESTSS